jgi:hypothetical protein
MATKKDNKQIKSKDRVKDFGECFTNEREVKAMLDMVKNESERIDSRVLEPACGTGNFAIEVLKRKLKTVKKTSTPKGRKTVSIPDYEKLSTLAVGCVYGIDIMIDNVVECRKRLYDIWYETFKKDCKQEPEKDLCDAITFILTRNILCGNTLSMKQVNEKAQDIDLPIIVSEWGFVMGNQMQRKDYRYDVLVGDKLPNKELSEDYIKNERNYLRGYITNFKEVQKYA